jgi:hypothetical protein
MQGTWKQTHWLHLLELLLSNAQFIKLPDAGYGNISNPFSISPT